MSTTSDMRVAVNYGLSEGSLLFLLKVRYSRDTAEMPPRYRTLRRCRCGDGTGSNATQVDNFMQYGADLQWLSAFPVEAEVLYPPLTYLQPTGRTQMVTVGGNNFKVVEVTPNIP